MCVCMCMCVCVFACVYVCLYRIDDFCHDGDGPIIDHRSGQHQVLRHEAERSGTVEQDLWDRLQG